MNAAIGAANLAQTIPDPVARSASATALSLATGNVLTVSAQQQSLYLDQEKAASAREDRLSKYSEKGILLEGIDVLRTYPYTLWADTPIGSSAPTEILPKMARERK